MALAMGFEELLADLAAHSDPVFVRQLGEALTVCS